MAIAPPAPTAVSRTRLFASLRMTIEIRALPDQEQNDDRKKKRLRKIRGRF